GGREITARRKIVRHVSGTAVAQPGQCHMGNELSRIGRQAEALADALDLSLQSVQIGRGSHGGPYGMRLLLPECSDARKRELEGRPADPVERIGDLVRHMAFDIAYEAQGEMVVLDVDPAGAGKASTQERKGKCSVAGNLEGGEKSRHGYL